MGELTKPPRKLGSFFGTPCFLACKTSIHTNTHVNQLSITDINPAVLPNTVQFPGVLDHSGHPGNHQFLYFLIDLFKASGVSGLQDWCLDVDLVTWAFACGMPVESEG